MGQHAVLKLEEVLRLGVCKLVRLIDLGPDLGKVSLQRCLDSLEVVTAVVEIPQYKEELL